MSKKFKAALISALLTSTCLITVVSASNHKYDFDPSVNGRQIQKTPAYSKGDNEAAWYYRVSYYEALHNNEEVYISTCDTSNNKSSKDVRVRGVKGSTRVNYRSDVNPVKGKKFKLQARADRYGATFNGKFCP